jgi:succinate dehydrogenase/fumarate reductase-like Fe-S protein
VNVNGKVKLACSAEVLNVKILELKPVNTKGIRDLVAED